MIVSDLRLLEGLITRHFRNTCSMIRLLVTCILVAVAVDATGKYYPTGPSYPSPYGPGSYGPGSYVPGLFPGGVGPGGPGGYFPGDGGRVGGRVFTHTGPQGGAVRGKVFRTNRFGQLTHKRHFGVSSPVPFAPTSGNVRVSPTGAVASGRAGDRTGSASIGPFYGPSFGGPGFGGPGFGGPGFGGPGFGVPGYGVPGYGVPGFGGPGFGGPGFGGPGFGGPGYYRPGFGGPGFGGPGFGGPGFGGSASGSVNVAASGSGSASGSVSVSAGGGSGFGGPGVGSGGPVFPSHRRYPKKGTY